MNAGPKTGRGMGYCNGYDQPRSVDPTRTGRGWFDSARGGGGRRWRNRFFATRIPGWVKPNPEQEIADLRAQAGYLQTWLEAILKRIEKLTSE